MPELGLVWSVVSSEPQDHLLLHMQNLAVVRDPLDLMLRHCTQQGGFAGAIPPDQPVSPPKGHGYCCILHNQVNTDENDRHTTRI